MRDMAFIMHLHFLAVTFIQETASNISLTKDLSTFALHLLGKITILTTNKLNCIYRLVKLTK